ncbi:Kinesin-like protein kif27, partial [Coelomomyces lativittatus]
MLQEVSPLPLNLNRSIMKTWPTNEKRCPIIVALRIKPLPSDPCSSHHKSSLRHDFHTVSLRTHYQNHTHSTLRSFSFDHVHNSDTTQESLYQQCAASMVTALVEGFNSTIFAY